LCIGCTPSTETANPKASVPNKSQKASKPSLEEIKKATNVPEMPQKDEGDGGEDPLKNPSLANEEAPAEFTVLLNTTKGDVLLEIHRDWAPVGVDRFYNLVKVGYFTDLAFFRVIGGFMAQFGMHGDPIINSSWKRSTIQDDPVRESNRRGYITFAKTNSPNSRSTQLFINYGNNKNLDSMQFAPIGQVVDEPGRGGGMSIIDQLYSEYGEGAPRGRGPSQSLMGRKGNTYLKSEYPNLDYIKSARVCGEDSTPESTKAYCP
jgi:peptidyl-prolyl cis-trans isomerase A (cyclophilin A)